MPGNRTNATAAAVRTRFLDRDPHWGMYCPDLTFEALMTYGRESGDASFIDAAMAQVRKRGFEPGRDIPWRSQPFCHFDYVVYGITGDTAVRDAFVRQSRLFNEEVKKNAAGLILHECPLNPPGAVLIDFLQDYASRMAHCGSLIDDGDPYFRECSEQFRLHANLLIDPESGFWRQGQGWLDDPAALSPGTWSRGQGWVVRGLCESCSVLPRNGEHYRTVRGLLEDLLNSLLRIQDDAGLWHMLPHRPLDASYPDLSGTGLIAYYTAKALQEGYVAGDAFRRAAERAVAGMLPHVDGDGVIHDVSRGPGPLFSEEDYLGKPGETEDGSGHGPFAVLFACAAACMLQNG